MHVEPDTIDDYEDDPPAVTPEMDEISTGVGSPGYVHRYILDDCQERFPETPIARFPETFDRLYFDAAGGPLLIDVLQDGTPEQLEEERARKRVAFKSEWCAEHYRRYLPLPESEATASRIRELLADAVLSAAESSASKPARARGKVQRPKATA